jgi:hypothetical protein
MNTQKLIEAICRDYSISEDEFNSNFKYGSLPEARQLYCMVLKSAGKKNGEIAEITGFSPPRVTITIQAGEKLSGKVPYFRQKYEALVKMFVK